MSSPTQERIAILTFRLGEQQYALPVTDVVEVGAMVELTTLPDASPVLLGIANRHGNALPILDLRQCFGLPPLQIATSTLFIMVEYIGQAVGLVVDEVYQVRYVQPEQFTTTPGAGRFVKTIINDGTDLIQLISLAPLLDQLNGSEWRGHKSKEGEE